VLNGPFGATVPIPGPIPGVILEPGPGTMRRKAAAQPSTRSLLYDDRLCPCQDCGWSDLLASAPGSDPHPGSRCTGTSPRVHHKWSEA
jgi:hypothetical protein